MKKILLTLCLLMGYATLHAATATVNGITWTYTVSNGEAKIYNSTNSPAIPSSTSGAITIPSTLGGYPVTSIGQAAFYYCSSLTSVTIPSSVTSIEWCAFYNCRSLTSVTIPSSVTSIGYAAFSHCSSLTSVTISEGVTSIGDYAFSDCSNLKITVDSANTVYASLDGALFNKSMTKLLRGPGATSNYTIPSSVTSIGKTAFEGCSSLTSVTIPKGVKTIGDDAFRSCSSLTSVTIPEGVTSIGDYAFDGCSRLTSITIPKGVKTIGDSAFFDCSSLTSITIPEGVTSIGEGAFYWCSSLTSVTIPKGVKTIGDCAFVYCYDLTSVTIPSSVTSIGESAFGGCSNLKITVDSANTVYASLDGALFNKSMTELLCGPGATSNYTIPSSVTSIGDSAFYYCSGLTSVTIPEGVTEIGNYAFLGCSSLKTVTFEGEPPQVGSSAFSSVASGCKGYYPSIKATAWEAVISNGKWNGLTMKEGNPILEFLTYEIIDGKVTITDCDMSASGTLAIPATIGGYPVTSIGNEAFYNCSGLTSVTIPKGVTSIGDEAFFGCSGLTSVDFKGEPPSVGSNVFYDISSSATGSYLPQYTSEWEAVITDGKWNGLTIEPNFFTYEIKDNAVTITGLQGTYPSAISIPATLGGYPVTSIGDRVFYNCSGLTSVTIPSSVTSIGDYAFSGVAPTTLTAAWLPSGMSNSNLTTLIIPEGVTSIGSFAFYGCSSLTSVTIPSSVTSIGYEAFQHCSSLTSVTIPSSVTSIGNFAFARCSSLTSFVVDSANQHYSAKNGLLCSKDGKTLVACPGGLTSVTIPSSVTSIGSSAFSYCSNLTSVTIPSSVTSIGSSAFYDCSSLTSVTIPDGVTSIGSFAFEDCSGLTSVTISEGVTTIGRRAFYGCLSLTSVTIPSSVTSIGNGAFSGCSDLTSFVVDSANQHYSAINDLLCSKDGKTLVAYPGGLTSVTIPSSVTSIGDYAFYRFESLTSVTIPSSVTSIGDEAFSGCSGLTSVDFKGEPPSVGSNVFYDISSSATGTYLPQYASEWEAVITGGKWNGLTIEPNFFTYEIKDNAVTITGLQGTYPSAISIPATLGGYPVTTIGDSAFEGCSSLTSVTIPSSVTTIGSDAFYNCSGLTSVHISNLAAWCGIDFEDIYGNPLYYATKLYLNGELITDLVIPEGVTSIGDAAFAYCSSLTSVTIPSSVTSIGDAAFGKCSSLTSVTIPEGVTTIGASAFYNCSSLTSVTIPSGVTSIGEHAFRECSRLTSVTIPSSVTTIGYYAFYDCSSLTSVMIPEGVTSIGHQAFYNCSSLTSVTIPSSVTTIKDSAFSGCSGLTSVNFKGEPPSVGSDVFSNVSSSATGTYLPQYASEWEAVITDGKWNGLWMLMARPENEILFTWDATKGFVDSNGNPVFIDNAFTLTAEFTMPSSVTSGDVITFHATSLDGMEVGALGMTDWSGAKVNYLIGSSKQLSGGHYSTGRFSNTGNKGNGPGVNVLKIEAESFENGTIATSNFKIDFAGASTVGSIENNGAVGEKGAEGATFGAKPFAFTSVTLPEGATLVSATLKMLPKDYTGPVESFGVNFMHGTGQEIITNDSFGFSKGAYVAPSQWTNVTASATGSTSINQYMVYWNARGSYQSGCATTSNMGKLLYGYLDDVASWNGRVKAEVVVTGLPVGKQYAVALILSGDGVDDGRNTYNEVFSPILINGETYSYVVNDGVVSLVKGEAAKADHARQWGDRSTAAIANGLVEGSNVVFVEGLSGMNLSITSAMDEKEVSRLTIAGVQVWITNEDVVIPDESKDRDVISVNFLGRATTTLVTEEAGLVPANGWNNLSGNSGTVSSLTVWSDEVPVTKPVELTYSANNVWSWVGATDDYLKGYLDDNAAQPQVSVTNIPFEEYSAIVYMATDVGGANIKPVLINGAYYIGTKMRMPLGYADRVIEQEKDSRLWGESRGLVGEYGRNALRVDGLSGDLSITGARGNGIARNGIAAIQIVNTGAPLLNWQEVDWTAKGQLVKVSELPALTDTCVRLKLADGATLDYDTIIAEGNQIVLEGEGITVNISNIDVSRADVEANISGATTIQTAYTETNGITVDGITYSYFFRGVTDANWETVSNWSSKVRSLGEEIRYVDLGGSYAPGVPDCPALWDYTLLDGEMMATIPTGDDGYKTVQVALLEGWDLRFTVRNGVHLKIATLKKLQIGKQTTDFSEWRIDDASKVTINAMGSSKWEGTPRFYINNHEGLFVNIDVGQADYYLDDDGSLQTTARIYGVQTVKAVKIDLGDSSQLGKTRISRKLIGFATNDNATFNYEMSGVTSTSSDVTPKYASVLENVGDYTFALKDDGYYIEFIAYDVAPDSILLPEGLPETTGEWLTDVLEASGITSGSAVLAEGTTVEALEAARLLGITPSVSVSGNIATVAAESTFEVSEVVVADNAVSLAVTITVEAGRFPTEVSLGGAVKLMVCDTLNGEWTEVTPLPTQIRLTRMSDTEATLAVTQALDTYKFFKVLVK